MAQILSIYGLVASVIISGGLVEKMALHTGFLQLGAGLSVGLCGLAAGFAIGIVGDAGGAYPHLFLSPSDCPFYAKKKVAGPCWFVTRLLANRRTCSIILVRASTQQPRLYVGMVLILIFAEVLGLYGVIVSILMLTRSTMGVTECTF